MILVAAFKERKLRVDHQKSVIGDVSASKYAGCLIIKDEDTMIELINDLR